MSSRSSSYLHASGAGGSSDTEEQAQERPALALAKDEVWEEFELDPELLSILCRRGRRRLRLLQLETRANIWIDRGRGVLHASGPEAALGELQRQLASLRGPRKNVSAAVWSELMRTRTKSKDPEEGLVARLQEESGCRIHIERDRHQVRIFGPSEEVAVCERLLEELDAECVEELVPRAVDATLLKTPALDALAQACGVTLRADKGTITVLGTRSAVREAAIELCQFVDAWAQGSGSPGAALAGALGGAGDARAADRAAAARRAAPPGREWYVGAGPRGPTAAAWAPMPADSMPKKAPLPTYAHEQLRLPADPQFAAGSWAPGGGSSSGSRAPAGGHEACSGGSCPTCGAGRFCIYCGCPTFRSSPGGGGPDACAGARAPRAAELPLPAAPVFLPRPTPALPPEAALSHVEAAASSSHQPPDRPPPTQLGALGTPPWHSLGTRSV